MAAGREGNGSVGELDAVVVGAGFAGLYMLHRLRKAGFSSTVLEAADDVGGTWYWNRYPGARCDIPTTDYTYSFDPELETEWTWSEKYATQPEILRYLQHVADKYDLRSRHPLLDPVAAAAWDDAAVALDDHDRRRRRPSPCRWYVMATGCLSMPKEPDIDGADRFAGEVYFTSRWPHEGVDFTGKRVAVIGTGSSGIQSIPLIAEQARRADRVPAHAELLDPGPQRPAAGGPPGAARRGSRRLPRGRQVVARRRAVSSRRWRRPRMLSPRSSASAGSSEAWEAGELFAILGTFADMLTNREANDDRRRVHPRARSARSSTTPRPPRRCARRTTRSAPSGRASTPTTTRRSTCPTSASSTCASTRSRRSPRRGIDTIDESFEFDAIVYATGFDAMTGALVGVDITGRDGAHAQGQVGARPAHLPRPDDRRVPEPVHDHRPRQPVGAVEHGGVDRAARRLGRRLPRRTCATSGFERIEPTAHGRGRLGAARQRLRRHHAVSRRPTRGTWAPTCPASRACSCPTSAASTPTAATCDEVVERGYLGFELSRPAAARSVNDGVDPPPAARRAHGADDDGRARTCRRSSRCRSRRGPRVHRPASTAARPPGPGGRRDRRRRAARRRRPTSSTGCTARRRAGPHPIVVYFHGGGWVLGEPASPTTRSAATCACAPDAVIVSVNYRHAPEAPLPGRRRRRVRRRAVGRRPRRGARRHPRPAGRRRLERRRQRRRRRLPAGPRRRRARHRRPAPADAGDRLRHDPAVVRRERRRLRPHRRR